MRISFFVYLTWYLFGIFYHVTAIHLCRTSVTKLRGQRHRERGYHRSKNLESNYNRIPKYPSPSYTGSLSRVPVSRLVSQTRLGRTTKVDRREESRTGWPARWWLELRQRWPKSEASKGDMFFVSNIYTFLLGAKPIRNHYVAPAILSRESVIRSLRDLLLAYLAPSFYYV